jgi:hypothetical protein
MPFVETLLRQKCAGFAKRIEGRQRKLVLHDRLLEFSSALLVHRPKNRRYPRDFMES